MKVPLIITNYQFVPFLSNNLGLKSRHTRTCFEKAMKLGVSHVSLESLGRLCDKVRSICQGIFIVE